ncbi:unnamed protein product [Ilex paraguariensis]|uniref:MYND-type domain-containing protein n=1 Tax=Ilex paraguariensis TaxID=185542 RepID=A0ABC8QZH3_9AQUA
MECAGKGSRTRCTGPAIKRCGRCQAVGYCSVSHQISHWSIHKGECERLEQHMKEADVLNDFPFTFSQEATVQVCEKLETRCSFLIKRGIHRVGMWMCECNCGTSLVSLDHPRLVDGWCLSSMLCPCKGPLSPIPEQLNSWKEYYEWRCIPLHSPVALLLHWPLTIYQAIQLAALRSLIPETSNELFIHYLGPDKELLQLAAFGELHALFPGVKVHMELVGPAIPEYRDGDTMDLHSYAHCFEADCICKSSDKNVRSSLLIGKYSAVTLRLRTGYYHDRYKEIAKVSTHSLSCKEVYIVLLMLFTWISSHEICSIDRIPFLI